jgi:hypothetical protein
VSKPTIYAIIWRVFKAIDSLPQFQRTLPTTQEALERVIDGFALISTNEVMWGCVGCLDGWLCQIKTPPLSHVLNQSDYFSGHYQCMGVNVQALCDHRCRFMYVGVLCPGRANDWAAFCGSQLKTWVDGLPHECFIAADNAYVCSDNLIVPFCGTNRYDRGNSNFNFFLLQLWIKIEQSFGLLVGKWRIFLRPLECAYNKISVVIQVAAKLHNYCIDKRVDPRSSGSQIVPMFAVDEHINMGITIGYIPSTVIQQRDRSTVALTAFRHSLRQRVIEQDLCRPGNNVPHNMEED